MKERIAKLLSVKSIVTIILTIVVAKLTLEGNFDIKDIYIMIISFYFGSQFERRNYEEQIDKNNKQWYNISEPDELQMQVVRCHW